MQTENTSLPVITDPREVIEKSGMGRMQIFVVAFCVVLNGLDGFDALSVSFASNGIKTTWALNDANLGFVLAMELIGMAIGSISLGWVADTIGRRKTILGCLGIMALGMFMVALSGTILELSAWRIFTGLGIGGLLSAVTALTAEFANLKKRALCIFIFGIGYPLGGVIGGEIVGRFYGPSPEHLLFWRIAVFVGIWILAIAVTAVVTDFSRLKFMHLGIIFAAVTILNYPLSLILGSKINEYLILVEPGWRSVFYLGGAVTTLFIPLFYFGVPESVFWLTRKQPAGALDKVNTALKRIGQKAIAALPEIANEVRRKSIGDLFSPALRSKTIIITVAYFMHITTYYFILKWVNQAVVNMGFSEVSGANMLKLANLGGLVGGILLGLLTLRISVKKISIAILALTSVFIAILGSSPDLNYFTVIVILCGFFGNAGIIALYALFPAAFPTHARASGVGFVLSIGRGGAYLSPVIVGFMFYNNLGLPLVTLLIGIPALVAAIVLVFLKLENKTE